MQLIIFVHKIELETNLDHPGLGGLLIYMKSCNKGALNCIDEEDKKGVENHHSLFLPMGSQIVTHLHRHF